MNKLNICIDIDGTITSPYHFIPYLNELYSKNITEEEYVTHDWQKLYDVNVETILSEFNEKCTHSYEEAKVVNYAKDIISKLKNNHNLYFVTARNKKLTDITTKWLYDNGFKEIEVHLLGSDYKVQKAKNLGCNIFIEDNPSNAMQLADAGMTILLIDTNYNKNIEHKNITRVNNWLDIDKFIDSIE